jgi:hypothetical protein
MSRECELQGLLRELPSPWLKDPEGVPAIHLTGPGGASLVLTGDYIIATPTPGDQPTVIPVEGTTLREVVQRLTDAGIAATLAPGTDPILAAAVLIEAEAFSLPVQTASKWGQSQWNTARWSLRALSGKPTDIWRWTSETWRLLDPIAEQLKDETENMLVGLAQMNLLTSATTFADWWGRYTGIPRKPGEVDDAAYTARQRDELLRPRENNLALANLLEHDFPPLKVSLVEDSVRRCFQPSDDKQLRYRPLRGWRYNVATIEIAVEGGFPSADFIAAAERNAACGVKVFVHGSWDMASMASPAGYDFAGTQILFGAPLPITINAPPPVGVGKIGPP